MKLSFEEASDLKYTKGAVYSVSYHNSNVDGYKYQVEYLNTDYMSYMPVFGGTYFTTLEEAKELSDKLNKR